MKNQSLISELQENIKRIENTLATGWYPKGYVSNCRASIENYQKEIERLQK